jgi:hypothetical protein
MAVRDAIVLIDREQGGIDRLHEHGCRVTPILRLKTMLNFYHANHTIDDRTFERCSDYLQQTYQARHDLDEEPDDGLAPTTFDDPPFEDTDAPDNG